MNPKAIKKFKRLEVAALCLCWLYKFYGLYTSHFKIEVAQPGITAKKKVGLLEVG